MRVPQLYNEVFSTHVNLINDTVKKHIERLKEIDAVLPPSTTFLILTNASSSSYEYISQNFEYVTGYSRKLLYEKGIPCFLSLVHADDIHIWLQVLKELMDFCTTEIKEEHRKRMNFQYNYRIRIANDRYINILENQIPLQLDRTGKPIIGLGHFTAFGNGDFHPIRASAKILNDNDMYETIFCKNYSGQLLIDCLSNRERDVLRMLALNKTSKQIAGNLFLSEHTVDTHRRNIIKKLNISSTSEILAYCRINGEF